MSNESTFKSTLFGSTIEVPTTSGTTEFDVSGIATGNTTDDDQDDGDMPLYGYPGYVFYMIHVTAIVSLCASVCFSIGVIIYFFVNSQTKNVWRHPTGERLVFYLSVADLCQSLTHLLDHGYMLAAIDHPPDYACTAFGAMMFFWILTQTLVVLFTAVNMCILVVKETKLKLGKCDRKLLVFVLGIPALVVGTGLCFDFWGPSGAWCIVDMRTATGRFVNNAAGVAEIATFVTCAVSYTAVWFKVRRVSTAAGSWTTKQKTYVKMARVMALFVVAYAAQWWPCTVQAFWALFADPHVSIIVLNVLFVNMGGVFNCLSYTVIRLKYSDVSNNNGRDLTTCHGRY